MIPLKHFLTVVVLHWWTSQDARVDAYDSLLRDMIHPFLTCADENDIPRDKSSTSGLNNDITTLRIGYDAIMTCIQIKLPVLRKSSDPTEWFIGYMFDITVATDLKNNFSNSKAYDFTCLETDNQSYSRESCFNDTRLALNLLYQAVQEQNITAPQEILHTICNSATESRFRQGICAKAGDPCAADIQDFLRYVLFPVLAGRNCHVSTPVVITETAVNSGLSLRKSAIFTCGNKVFGSDPLEQLFPPSESTVSRVTNTTAARIEQQHSMQRFCAKRHKYVSCVVDVINDGHYENYLTGNLLYTDTLQHAFDTLCDNQHLISSQYECTFHAMSAGTCYGGVEDLLNTAAKKFRNTSAYTICMEMKSAVSCRVETQLKLCSAEFATVMERFYENLLGKKCYPAGLRPNAMTDLPPCYANFSLGMQQRMKNYEEHQNISIVVGTEMEYVCKNEVDSITDCMYEVVSNPQKSLDIFAAELYGAKNIKPLTERACDLVPMLKPNLQCVIHGFETLVNSAVNCLTEFAKGFPKLMNISDGTFNEKTAEKICGLIGSLEPCVTPVFTTCDTSLGNRITALFREVKTACNNPSYQIKAKDGTSSASSYSYTTLLFVLIVLAYHVI